jgi:hypothetical protein
MNCYPSNNYKQHGPISSNRGRNITNHFILLPKNFLFEIHNPEYRAEMKHKISQKQNKKKFYSNNSIINFNDRDSNMYSHYQH